MGLVRWCLYEEKFSHNEKGDSIKQFITVKLYIFEINKRTTYGSDCLDRYKVVHKGAKMREPQIALMFL
jgi:hypothetical protein